MGVHREEAVGGAQQLYAMTCPALLGSEFFEMLFVTDYSHTVIARIYV